jgi:hypothetical protein
MSNEKIDVPPCPRAQITGEILIFLMDMDRVTDQEAIDSLESLSICGPEPLLTPCDTATIVGAVMIHALENLWIDIDEAITITAKFADCSEVSALQLLV